jgi:GMP synthase (glutamine-hydrolysing)
VIASHHQITADFARGNVSNNPSSGSRRVSTTGDIEVSTYLEIAEEKLGQSTDPSEAPRGADEAVVVLDFGSQFSRLIARRLRESHVYCEIFPPNVSEEQLAHLNVKGFILSGGPASVFDDDAPQLPAFVLSRGVPVLGICYGMQILAHAMGGVVAESTQREYGHAVVHQNASNHPIFAGLEASMPVWMSHADKVTEMPPGFECLGYTENSPVAMMGNDSGIIGLQFHPEVVHTPSGKELIENFLYKVCWCKGLWTPGNFIDESVARIREQVGSGRVICALSGGVDSAITAALIHRAIGEQLTCIFVDNGLLRREEPERVVDTFQRGLGLNLIHVKATDRFLDGLKDVIDPEQKRRSIGETFIRAFEDVAEEIEDVGFLAQGTLYPDVIESTSAETGAAAKIKTHHNVGGLPAAMKLSLVEPLRYLFKDEVRDVGLALGLPEEIVMRQPFPGPGLAIRIIGEVTPEKLEVLRSCDWIVMDEIKGANLYRQLWQSFAVLTDTRSVGVMGDHRTYGYLAAIRAVTSEDAMTADWARLPYEVLAKISSRIVNEVPEVNRVVYDITSKPPGTIEWE